MKSWITFAAALPSPPATIASVAVACSFAISAEIVAIAPCQLPKPSGAKNHATQPPIEARMDLSRSSSTTLKPQSKVIISVSTTQAGKITMPAFQAYALTRSHVWITMPLNVGRW